jgi:predicted ferric reductase
MILGLVVLFLDLVVLILGLNVLILGLSSQAFFPWPLLISWLWVVFILGSLVVLLSILGHVAQKKKPGERWSR